MIPLSMQLRLNIYRANHRYAILDAKRALDRASEGCFIDGVDMEAAKRFFSSDAVSNAAAAYDEVVAAFTDPADFEPYTEAYLDAHTVAIDTLTAAFDTLSAAFAALDPADNFYTSVAAYYKSTCDLYTSAASAYSNAAYCALTTALEGNLQSAKDDFEFSLLEDRAANPATVDAVTAKAKAAAFKAKSAEDAAKSKALEHKGKAGVAKAEAFIAKAKSAEAKAKEALETSE
jgi:hypothetical protein